MSQTTQPLVSIVIPTYKHADYVLQTLASVTAQTYSHYEIIVVNDGSPDDTHERIKPLVDAGTIRYFRQENAGQSVARNRGIAAAQGEYIALLDDDDLWPPDKLEWQVAALQGAPEAALVYGRVETIDDAGKPSTAVGVDGKPPLWTEDGPDGEVWAAFALRNRIVSPGQCLIRRTALRSLAGEPLAIDLWGCDDYDLWLRLARQFPFRFLPRLSLLYRLHANNASRSIARLTWNTFRMYEKHYTSEKEPTHQAALADSLKQSRDSFVYHTLRPLLTGDKALAQPPPELQKAAWKRARPRMVLRLLKERWIRI